jgi:two-component system, NtrC family, response regulator AtoC
VARVPEARVLITGESGTGKSYLARAIHELAGSGGRFVEVSCATLPANLMESELFGHEKGAFTDARTLKRGLVELASGGTLFLDEIGALPPDMQAKLLVFLESRQIRRVGGSEPIAATARVIAATSQDLREAVRAGRFREDLLYRLDVAAVRMPSLHAMPGVMAELAARFVAEIAAQLQRPAPALSPAVASAAAGLPLARQRPGAAQRAGAGTHLPRRRAPRVHPPARRRRRRRCADAGAGL